MMPIAALKRNGPPAGTVWPVGSHRYWRINITANGGATDVAILEMEMYTQKLGQNVCTGGTAGASSYNNTVGTPFTPARAFDGSLFDHDTSTTQDMWASLGSLPQWLSYDFGVGNAKAIVEVGIWGRIDSTHINQDPTTLQVQFSDDNSTWTTAWTVTGLTWTTAEFKRLTHPSATRSYTGSPHGSHTYWRLWELRPQNSSRNVCGFAEMQMRATIGGANQTSGGTASASTFFSGAQASNAFDGNATTVWSGAGASFEDWIQYQFASAVSVGELVITARNDSFYADAPQYAALQYADGSSGPWTTAWRFAPAAFTTGSTQTFDDPNYI